MARGSTRQRDNGMWESRIDTGLDPATGKRKQVSRSFKREGDAHRWVREQLTKIDRGTYVALTKQTTRDYLVGWLALVRGSDRRRSTIESYDRMLRKHAIPKLGNIPLQQLGPDHLRALYSDMAQAGLSRRTVEYVHVVLSRALEDAVEEDKLARNVAKLKTVRKQLPPASDREMVVWTDEALGQFLGQLEGDALYLPVLLAATTGMRRGEVLGLRWGDLGPAEVKVQHTITTVRDLDTGKHVIVTGKPKTAAGRRTIPLLPEVVAALKAHRLEQEQEKRWGEGDYQDQGLVFAEYDGAPIHPDHFRQRFEWRVAKSGLPRIRFHDLRHTFATGLLAAGENPVEVSKLLGHAKVSTTMNIYAHAMPGRDQALMGRLGERLAGVVS